MVADDCKPVEYLDLRHRIKPRYRLYYRTKGIECYKLVEGRKLYQGRI